MRGQGFLPQSGDGTLDDDVFLASGQYRAAVTVERGVVLMVAGQLQQVLLRRGEDDTADIAPVDRAAAHAAGLDAGIEGAVPELGAVKIMGGALHQRRLGVAGTDPAGDFNIALLHEDIAFQVDEYAAEGVVPGSLGFLCHGHGPAEEFGVHLRGEVGKTGVACFDHRWLLSGGGVCLLLCPEYHRQAGQTRENEKFVASVDDRT